MGWVNAVLASAQRQGLQAEHLLADAGIPAQAVGWERWPIDFITRLWHAAERGSGDPGFGLKTGARISPSSIHVIGFALQSAATLRQAIGVLQKFQSLVSDGGRFQMLENEADTWLVYHPCQGQLAFSPHQIEAVLAAVITLGSWVKGAPICPRRVQFSESRIGPLAGYRDAFGCAAEFEQAFSGMLLDNAVLDSPLPQADPEFAQVHVQYAAARLAALDHPALSIAQLREWIHQRMDRDVPRRATAAQALGMSERTLARRLREQGRTFESLIDDVRRELALQAIGDTRRTVADIAQSLGFAEARTFHRAFLRWTAMTPGDWRKRGQGTADTTS